MPFGSFKLNGIGKFLAPSGGTPISAFDGTQFNYGEYLRTTSITTNAMSSTSRTATVSFWIKLNNETIGDYTQIWGMTTSATVDNRAGLNIFFRSTNQIVFYGYKGVANGWVMQLSTPTGFLPLGQWTHISFSYDRSVAGKFSCYKNGQAVTLTNTRFNNDTDGWNTATRVAFNALAYDATLTSSDISLSQFWLDDTYLDLSADNNKFYNNGPVDLGSNGTGSGLSQPMIYHTGGSTVFATNNGRTSGTRVAYTLSATGTLGTDSYPRTNYTIPTAGFTDDSNTKILLKFDGGFTDTVGSGRTAKTITTINSPTRSSTVYKFGTQSLIAPGSTSFPSVYTTTTITDFVFSNKDFTCEAWIYYSSFTNVNFGYAGGVPKSITMSDGTNNNVGWGLGANYDGKLRLFYWNGSGPSVIDSNIGMSAGVWNHIAFDHRSSDGRMRLLLNGQVVATTTRVGSFTGTAPQFRVGGFWSSDATSHWSGYVDEVRVSHAIRY